VNSYHYVRGGADVVYFNHARLLEQNGWNNSYFAMQYPKNIACETESYFPDLVDFEEKSNNLPRTLLSASRVVYSVQAQRRLAKLLDDRKVDLAHYHGIYHHLSPSVLVEAKRRGIPTVMTAHDLKLACPSALMLTHDGVCERCKGGKVWNVAVHKCIKNSLVGSALIAVESAFHKSLRLYKNNIDRVVAPSRFHQDKLIEWGWRADQVTYIPNFVPDIPEDVPPVGQYLLYFGRLSTEKGLVTLVKAAAEAGVQVKVAGTGPQEAVLKELAETLQAPVEFVGFKSGRDLWDLVDGAKAMVLPSECYENGPMSVIEGFGRGKPLIGARIGGIPELTEEGVTGWTFAAGDIDDLAAALSRAQSMSDSDIAVMGKAARALVEERFSAARYLASVKDLYMELGVG
jgi:glycosyltransferase involved in cell wall biosynthesis